MAKRANSQITKESKPVQAKVQHRIDGKVICLGIFNDKETATMACIKLMKSSEYFSFSVKTVG